MEKNKSKKFLCKMRFNINTPYFYERIILASNEKNAAVYYANLPTVKKYPDPLISIKEIETEN